MTDDFEGAVLDGVTAIVGVLDEHLAKITAVVGPKGDKGDIGLTGDRGPAGPEGKVGPRGPAGLTGLDGVDGADGKTGPPGEPGPKGIRGPLGPRGPQGEKGDPGEKGEKGDRGPAGPGAGFRSGGGSYFGGGGGVASGGDKIAVQQSGVLVGSATALNFEGATVAINAQVATITGGGGGGGGAVASVNGQTGVVVLAAADVGADASGAAAAAQAASQPLDSDLTAIAALSTTAYGRGLLALADNAALGALGTGATASTEALGDAAAGGTLATHKHGMPAAAVVSSGLTMATGKMLGRATAGTGAVEEVPVTGSGSAVLATSPVLVAPALGTPASGVGTNLTGIPESGVTGLVADLAAKAPLASPTFTGTVTVPAPVNPTDATTKTYVDAAVTGLLDFKGATDTSANPNYPAALKGDSYVVSVAGKIGGAAGVSVDVGDVYVAAADNAGGTQASVGASWFIMEHNLVGALLAANNLSDLTNAGTARTNLGLGTAATHATGDFDASGAAAAAQAAAIAASQPLDSDLTALAGLAVAADTLPYGSGTHAMSLAAFTAAGRALIDDADAAAQRTTLGLGTAATHATSDYDVAGAAAAAQAASQPLDSDLTAIAALSTTSFGRGLLALADAAALRTSGGLVIGTDVEAHDSDLTTIAGLAPSNDDVIQRKAGAWTNRTIAQLLADLAAPGTTFQPLDSDLTALAGLAIDTDTLPYGSGSHAMSLAAFTAAGRALVAGASAAAQVTTLGLDPLIARNNLLMLSRYR